ILKRVMKRILQSYYEEPREILLFFYYPSEEYVSYLMTHKNLIFVDEIYCMDLYEEENDREEILIFRVVF
ncbi:MAG: SAM-dependent methyltransferase, partial [Lachnospiraceae bacterium]|nr:SAM-dependent methyltransferase [Lachnospiraceae bacterium]